ncbi:hypothetical protein [Leptolyngbya ohadii]|uniref:hypothetical protein n=1 Tax=Leptolyngbya ohadii TaxID=1962290 RepID=UPI0015C60B58|nr:hypothetical protein [Leptolyngbya ohadii]
MAGGGLAIVDRIGFLLFVKWLDRYAKGQKSPTGEEFRGLQDLEHSQTTRSPYPQDFPIVNL